jgi:hypothetical protein
MGYRLASSEATRAKVVNPCLSAASHFNSAAWGSTLTLTMTNCTCLAFSPECQVVNG